jgi:hypothetical protein
MTVFVQQRRGETRACDICGREFYGTPSAIQRGHARFCSKACRLQYMGSFSGQNSWHWKGGRDARELRAQRLALATVGAGVTLQDWSEIRRRFNDRCACCRRPASEVGLMMDHIVPLSRGGTHQPENMQPLCIHCNQWKYVRTIAFSPDSGGIEVTDMRAFIESILAGDTPLEAIDINWPYLEAFDEGGVRAKSTRVKL